LRLFSSPPSTENAPDIEIGDYDNNDNDIYPDAFQHSTISSILEGLNPSQVEAVTQPNSAITRVLAGPGSGKTRVLTCRIAYLLEEDRNNRILAVTFTRKASGEMKQRVETLLLKQQGGTQQVDIDNGIVVETTSELKGLDRVTLGTFHSVCAKVLRYNGNLLATLPSVVKDMVGSFTTTDGVVNLDGSFVILDQSDQLRIVKECLKEAEIDLKKSSVKPQAILNAIGQIKESLSQGIDPFRKGDKNKGPISKTLRTAKQIYGTYREKLFSNNAVDFDDLIFMTRELLMEHRDLRQRLHKRWRHVLVDEFQDTSRSQMDLVKLLTSDSLFVVGDADQSIYSWRGAHVGSLADFATEMQNYIGSGVQSVYLKENYR
jgi:DNA helicase-2/ATP-dependent DNA helicase PcrA